MGKTLAIFAVFILIVYFWKLFQDVLEGYKPEIGLKFLSKLCLSEVRNEKNQEKMLKAWESFWPESSEYDERELNKVFVEHIDRFLQEEEFALAARLSQGYQDNFAAREDLFVVNSVLPKVFEWMEIFWKSETKIQSEKVYVPTTHFQHSFFPKVVQRLLLSPVYSSFVFEEFEKYIKHVEKKIQRERKEGNLQLATEYKHYIDDLLRVLLSTFYENRNNAGVNPDVWKSYFPKGWKITSNNSEEWEAETVLDHFIVNYGSHLFQKSDEPLFNQSLSDIVNMLFPGVNSGLFTAWIRFACGPENDIKGIIKLNPMFRLSNSFVSQVGNQGESERKLLEDIEKRKEETINVIFGFLGTFDGYRDVPLTYDEDDFSEEDRENWGDYSEEKKKQVLANFRRSKFRKLLGNLNSKEIKDFCGKNEVYEAKRKGFVKLIELLLERVEQEATNSPSADDPQSHGTT
ncbi:MAG: hypothetical protein GKS04_00505 [Candidatus Mycalebacterium zealandia]|nr:MAG: hypothetical protein GKS04_00505 [Candidatus Mycalebacterium zealandia]